MKTGKDITKVLTITRNGKSVNLSDILAQAKKTFDNIGKNLVSFAVGDVISASKE